MDAVLDRAGVAFRALPDEAPLAMPTQGLRVAPPRPPRPSTSPNAIWLRRLVVIGGATILSIVATYEMYLVLGASVFTPLTLFMLALFLALFAWIALSFTSAILGFISLIAGRGRRLLSEPPRTPTSRTALLMPVYNESPARMLAGLQAIDESLRNAGLSDHFDIFILSDSTEPESWIAEEIAFLTLRERTAGNGTAGHDRIFYRRRAKNTARKAGNIADWVERFGAAYEQFLILDADSIMTADALWQLVSAMERHPDVGLIQTLPMITGGTTFFARLQQFAGRVYGPLIAHGIALWHGAEGNYWGHNAIIRTRAFAAQAGLPGLRGRKPFGGPIMSHDFIEAALMRRAGWAIHMVPGMPGSYEEGPPSLIDLSIRDRRWCQGNLQHIAVLPARGLTWISRLHLMTGIGAYLTAPLWLLFLLTGILIALQAHFIRPDYFPAGKSLFPQWPIIDPVRAMWMFVGTMGLLLAPKLLGAIAVLLRARDRRGHGGIVRLFIGIIIETIVTGLIAPVVMLSQSSAVCEILLGRDSGWNTQRRDDGSVPARELARRFRRHTILGLLLGGFAASISLYLALWMLPVVLGLTLSIPLAILTGQRRVGLALRRWGLLRTPEEAAPPSVLRRAAELAREPETADPLGQLLSDPALLDAHRHMLPPPRRKRIDPIDPALLVGREKLAEALSFDTAWTDMTRQERLAVLADADCLDRLAELYAGSRCVDAL